MYIRKNRMYIRMYIRQNRMYIRIVYTWDYTFLFCSHIGYVYVGIYVCSLYLRLHCFFVVVYSMSYILYINQIKTYYDNIGVSKSINIVKYIYTASVSSLVTIFFFFFEYIETYRYIEVYWYILIYIKVYRYILTYIELYWHILKYIEVY